MSEHVIPAWMAWHGRLMVLAWCFLLPAGVLIARYFKVTLNQHWPLVLDNKFWWHSHLTLQYSGMALMSAAAALAIRNATNAQGLAQLHRVLGWVVCILAWLQVTSGLLRGTKGGPGGACAPLTPGPEIRGDHYDMTPRRIVFEYLHKAVGYYVLLIAAFTVWIGLALANAPLWMYIAVVLIWLCWCGIFARLQRRGYCIDTYQAIWGPSPDHPGSRRRPIGWGIRRGTSFPLRR